jgi:hypothetical protein
MRRRWAARVAQFWRSAASRTAMKITRRKIEIELKFRGRQAGSVIHPAPSREAIETPPGIAAQ